MRNQQVSIVPTGLANLASIKAAFSRLAVEVNITRKRRTIESASHVVLPGVGAFGPAVGDLDASGVLDAVGERWSRGRPTLAVCLGMHLLFESSEETPGIAGLGILRGKVERFAAGLRTPQMGWNTVTAPSTPGLLESGEAYFANSFRVAKTTSDVLVSHATHGAPFVAAVQQGNCLACQFHPELSGAWGLSLIERWLSGEGN